MLPDSPSSDFNRREFLKGGSMATLMSLLGGVELFAQTEAAPAADGGGGGKVKIAVIGLGAWGREILNTLGKLKQAEVAAICDTYEPFVKRGAKLAPGAAQTTDYRTILENKEITTVVVATPTHKHKDIVVAALQAGKHVYCEAPLANTVEDARAIALAAKCTPRCAFQAGLQMRASPHRHFLLPFIRAGNLGTIVMARAQWHKKTSWRAASGNPEQAKALNWRLDRSLSLGLVGELGIHQIDQAAWILNARPKTVTGFGSLLYWNQDNPEPDDRDVPDTVQAVFEFPRGVRLSFDSMLANTFEGEYEIYYGSNAAVLFRDNKAWMFKEVDSPLFGWEVYAKKEAFHDENGVLLLKASKSDVQLEKPAVIEPFTDTPLFFALRTFLKRCAAIDDFVSLYGADDLSGLPEHLTRSQIDPAAGYLEGYQATVTAIKANEAILGGQRLQLKPEWYELA
jgi:predicted dehydrogenase